MFPPHRPAAVVAVAVLFCVLLLPGSLRAAPPEAGPATITLYASATRGWGLDSTNVTSPGPTLTVYVGYPVTIRLIGLEGAVTHNWFIDYNGDNLTAGEPTSKDFVGAGPLLFPFTPDRVGNYTYKCFYHSGTMQGTIRILAQTNVTLYGDLQKGWGLSNSTIGSPGPPLVLLAGTNVTFTLIANDTSVVHGFFIDYDGDGSPNGVEPKLPDFSGGNPVTRTIRLDRAGNFSYYCQYHPGIMKGNVVILGPTTSGGGFNVALIPGILVGALGGVLIFAAIYHVRAVRASKRAK